MIQRKVVISLIIILAVQSFACAQDSVLGLLKDNVRMGNHHYEQQDFEKALKYFKLASPHKINTGTQIKIARCLYFLKNYGEAQDMYAKLNSKNTLPMPDLLYFAELNTSVGNYSAAIDCYNDILRLRPGDAAILQRIWQLSNVNLFFEDSAHYTIRELPVNSRNAELSPVPYKNGVVFLSDRKLIDFNNPDDQSSEGAFTLYYTEIERDSMRSRFDMRFKKPINFGKGFAVTTGIGPVSFYSAGDKCVFAAIGSELSSVGIHKTQLFFSERKNGKWSHPQAFEHNNKEDNLTDPSISSDGSTLYFASDKSGGHGGLDIYKSEWKDGKWTTPENLGEHINTAYTESHPFIYFNTLYFCSDGHPGLGGLDIFSTIIFGMNVHDVKNLGYPVNSGSDDFGFVLRTGSQGYFTSNRKNGGYDDDVYALEMDFRTYPFDISGIIKFKDGGADELHHSVMANAKVELVDNDRNEVILTTHTDENGKFSISIPWFSKYLLRLSDHENEEYIVSLEINKESSENSNYEIVVVKKIHNGLEETIHQSD